MSNNENKTASRRASNPLFREQLYRLRKVSSFGGVNVVFQNGAYISVNRLRVSANYVLCGVANAASRFVVTPEELIADPNPASSHPIHLLIGADLYGSLLLGDLRQSLLGTPTARCSIGYYRARLAPLDKLMKAHLFCNACRTKVQTFCCKNFGKTRKCLSSFL